MRHGVLFLVQGGFEVRDRNRSFGILHYINDKARIGDAGFRFSC
jgi:hypothetical protein